MDKGTFTCHNIEWFDGDKCLECEREQRIEALSERIDIQITTLRVYRDKLAEIARKLDDLERSLTDD